ncbi:uncharacterized protein GA0111570_10866 [Raineyella antarctica]|uniref:Metal-binding protein n=1 Tax=Raineyella antarctica TaxID=1577474 RepID=A0A1G6HAU5_9ACTN|nr:uncharacterized protein GA0111570_10866 [Raineyella antarctica]
MTTHHHLDPRSPLVLDTHDLGRRAGAMRELHETIPAPAGIGTPVIGIPEGSPIELDLRLESVSEGVLVSGIADVRLEGECSRCLTPIQDSSDVDLQELFLYADQHLEGEDEEDVARMQGELLDLEPALRDAVVLDLPFTPLCREDCAGLCQVCGANLNDDPDHDHGPATDSRWVALEGWSSEDGDDVEDDAVEDEDAEYGDEDAEYGDEDVPDEDAGDGEAAQAGPAPRS